MLRSFQSLQIIIIVLLQRDNYVREHPVRVLVLKAGLQDVTIAVKGALMGETRPRYQNPKALEGQHGQSIQDLVLTTAN